MSKYVKPQNALLAILFAVVYLPFAILASLVKRYQ